MKIALFGYGKMGQEIERLVNESGRHQIVSTEISDKAVKEADVVIDFTSPEVVVANIKKVATFGKNMVVGTTGWYQHLEEVEEIVKKEGIGLIYAQNFSVGANIFFQIVAQASKLFAEFGSYDVYGFEAHHSGKKDSPSGTALRIAKEIMDNFPSKKKIQTEKLNQKVTSDQLHFASIRGGRNPGFHQVVFDSPADEVRLSHQAHNRSGFAQGAILAAEFIQGKKGIYSFDEVFKT